MVNTSGRFSANTRIGMAWRPLHRMLLSIWVTFLMLLPIYLWQSGAPQVAHFVIVIGIFSLLLHGRFSGSPRIALPAVLFAYYVVVVNLAWSMRLGAVTPLVYGLYYSFNALVFLAGMQLAQVAGRRFWTSTIIGVAAAIVMETVYVFASRDFGYRSVGTFNNPNQLGYFGVLSASILAVTFERTRPSNWTRVVGMVVPGVITLASLSKAAIGSYVVLLAVMVFRYRKVGVVILALILGLFLFLQDSSLVQGVVSRWATLGRESDDSLVGRGYDRIWQNFQYVILGAGEGTHDALALERSIELHSSWGTVLFSYGLVGLALWSWLIVSIWRRAGSAGLYLVPAFVYGLAHDGLRFTLFWVLLSVIASLPRQGMQGNEPTGYCPAESQSHIMPVVNEATK